MAVSSAVERWKPTDESRSEVMLHSAGATGEERIHRELQWPAARRVFERRVVHVAGRRPAEADEFPRSSQSRAFAQCPGGSNARGIRGVAQGNSQYIDGARTPEPLDCSSGARETRVNSERRDSHCPKPLASFVTENGSGLLRRNHTQLRFEKIRSAEHMV